MFGGELTTYTDLMMEAREEATERMVEEAVELGGNAIVNIRVETSNLATNASEIYCTTPPTHTHPHTHHSTPTHTSSSPHLLWSLLLLCPASVHPQGIARCPPRSMLRCSQEV